MKTVLSVAWKIVVMVLAAFAGFIAGMTVPAIRVQHVLSQTSTSVRTYDFNWIIAVVVVYVLLLLIGAVRKRLQPTAVTATIALVVTLAGLALFTHIGIKEASLY